MNWPTLFLLLKDVKLQPSSARGEKYRCSGDYSLIQSAQRAVGFAEKATHEDGEENYIEAYAYYKLAIDYLENCES